MNEESLLDENVTNSSQYEYEFFELVHYHDDRLTQVVKYIHPLIVIVGFSLNVIVAFGLSRHRMLTAHHSSVQLIALFLSCAYILVSQLSTYTAKLFHHNGGSPTWLCKIWSFFDNMVWATISWQMTAMLVDRFIRFASGCWPRSARWAAVAARYCQRATAAWVILAIYVLCAWLHVYVLHYFISYEIDSETRVCGIGNVDNAEDWEIIINFFRVVEIFDRILLPTVTAIFIVFIVVLLRLSRRRLAFSFYPLGTESSVLESTERTYTKLLLAIVGLTFMLSIFLFLVELIEFLAYKGHLSLGGRLFLFFIDDILWLCYFLLIIVNPLLCLGLLPDLRDELHRVLIIQPVRCWRNGPGATLARTIDRVRGSSEAAVRFRWSLSEERGDVVTVM